MAAIKKMVSLFFELPTSRGSFVREKIKYMKSSENKISDGIISLDKSSAGRNQVDSKRKQAKKLHKMHRSPNMQMQSEGLIRYSTLTETQSNLYGEEQIPIHNSIFAFFSVLAFLSLGVTLVFAIERRLKLYAYWNPAEALTDRQKRRGIIPDWSFFKLRVRADIAFRHF